MKQALLTFSLFAALAVNAQDKIDDYQSDYFDKAYDISVSQGEKDTNELTFYIDCASADKLHTEVCLDIKGKNYTEFVSFLNAAKDIYAKWKKTAKDNNVTELDKDIEVKKTTTSAAFLYGGKWNFDFNVLLKPRVSIIKGEMLLIISSPELQSSSNQFMKHDGFLLVFSSPEEVDTFISKISIDKARAFLSKKNKTSDLFKN